VRLCGHSEPWRGEGDASHVTTQMIQLLHDGCLYKKRREIIRDSRSFISLTHHVFFIIMLSRSPPPPPPATLFFGPASLPVYLNTFFSPAVILPLHCGCWVSFGLHVVPSILFSLRIDRENEDETEAD